jgi:hypothetical protein
VTTDDLRDDGGGGKATRWRVVTASATFDLERFGGTNKDGVEVWHKEAYCRSRADLLASLRSRGLSEKLATDVPSYHDDAYRALSQVAGRPAGLSDAQRAALEKAHAAKRAKRAAT